MNLHSKSLTKAILLVTAAILFSRQNEALDTPAVFRITTDVVNRDVGAFTATIGDFGNVVHHTAFGFEIPEFRTRFFASADAKDEALGVQNDLSGWDTRREGFLDGADVRIYRIIDGKMLMVRSDKAAESLMSGWNGLLGGAQEIIAPDVTSVQYKFAPWERPGVPYYFAIVSVDNSGNQSPESSETSLIPDSFVAKNQEKNQFENPKMTKLKVDRNFLPKTDKAIPAPQNFTGKFDPKSCIVTFTWSKPLNAVAGYRIFRSDYAPVNHKGYKIKLAGKAANENQYVKKGDWVVLAKSIPDFSRSKYLSNRVYDAGPNRGAFLPFGIGFQPDEQKDLSWTLEKHLSDSPVKDGGQSCGKITMGAGKEFKILNYNHGGTNQGWYTVLRPNVEYVVEFWAKQQGMSDPTITFSFPNFYNKEVPPQSFKLTEKWQKHSGVFKVKSPMTSPHVQQMSLAAKGPGTLWIDNYRVYQKDTAFMDYTQEEYAILAKSGMSALRTHAFIKTGTRTYNMEQITNPPGSRNTLPQTLTMMKKARIKPWLQIEMHMSPEEWKGFIEYMAAPYDPKVDTPQTKYWAAKRYAQGQAAPWTDEFSQILFEISNETWNGLFSPWTFQPMTDALNGRKYNSGEVYGLFQEHVIKCMKASPYWNIAKLDKKFSFVLGGWSINEYGIDAINNSPNSNWTTIAAYNGGWDEGEGPATGGKSSMHLALLQTPQYSTYRTQNFRLFADKALSSGRKYDLGTYEAGPGYALSGLNNQEKMTKEQVRNQENTMKSLGAGTATLDSFLDKAYYGFKLQNFFTFYFGRTHWVSHTSRNKGYRAHPCWMVLELFNNYATGDFLRTETSSVPVIDTPQFKRRKAQKNVPLAGCYATRKGDRMSVFVLSRKVAGYPNENDLGYTPVTVELPFTQAKSVRLFRFTGDAMSHNIDSEKVKLEEVKLPADAFAKTFTINEKSGADKRGLPPGMTYLYVFEGINASEGKDVKPVFTIPETEPAKTGAKSKGKK
jgi:hypothetical protein